MDQAKEQHTTAINALHEALGEANRMADIFGEKLRGLSSALMAMSDDDGVERPGIVWLADRLGDHLNELALHHDRLELAIRRGLPQSDPAYRATLDDADRLSKD